MSLTVQQLLADAKRLSGRLRDHDASADNVISNAQEVLKAVDAMRQYQEDIDNLNSIAHNRPRAQLVLGIQQENRHIRQLQHENKELRAALEEHQNAIELIMSKYRQHITCLVHSSKPDKNAINQQKSLLLQERADKICEMASVMNQSIQIDEERQAQEQELMSRLLTENKGLREMLEISSRNGSRTDPLIGPKVISRSCQTEDIAYSLLTAPSKSILADEITNSPNGSFTKTYSVNNSNDLVFNKEAISNAGGMIDGRQQECLSATKDKSTGNSKASTSSPAATYTSSTSFTIGAATISTSTSPVAMNHNSTSNTGLSLSPSTETTVEECSSPSRPVSAASDSSESSTESSTTSEEDEDQEVAFNTIKRRQTKINVITPKSPSLSPTTNSNNSVASKISATSNVALNDTQNQCDETKYIVNSNGDNACKMSAVNDCLTGDVNDNNKENGDDKEADNNVEVTKVNGDKNDIVRTQSAITIDSVIKGDEKGSKKEQKSPKSANSMNALVNAFDEQPNSLPGINLPARFKKANSKAKKSTIRKSDLRNSGSGSSDVDKKLSK